MLGALLQAQAIELLRRAWDDALTFERASRSLAKTGSSWRSGMMKNHRVFEVFHKMYLKSHFLTCNVLVCLLHLWLQMSDFLMSLLHSHLFVFLGVP